MMSGTVDASYPTETVDRVRSSNTAGAGFSMKLKAVADKNPSSRYPLDKNVAGSVNMPSTSFALGGTSSRSSMKPQPPTEGGNSGHGNGGGNGPPSGWISPFQRISSAK
ncbi:hypothetical protein SAY86_018203 [Trapa natans]|uniref:Uncharacterized protein n=1 Tax=Trapa natans TaxID=22666 RepID=A0AAN7LML0_TRANT|nr:hypothetical protein SAY86_018203 [Trapa natans]